MSHKPLGRLSPRIENPEVLMLLCTAGHVDHGKTSLVTLLTGCQTDRLKEEQERGLTIELGFAPCFLGGNHCVGIVDVPGHEKFVKNMVAGVSGIAMTLLVIAADDGIMPQTIEHFQIMDLLGVRHGMIALTKTDLVEPEVVEQRIQEIRGFFAGTFLDGVPICPVSSHTFEGYPEFYQTLLDEIGRAAHRPRPGIFRMPVEKVFTQEGFGSVVTGIPVAGRIHVGDRVELVPGGQVGKVRGIQRFLRTAESGGCGQCLAINIPEFSKTPPVRGQVICEPGFLEPAQILHLELKAVPGLENPLKNAENVKFHAGTVEAPGKIHLLEDRVLTEGQSALATLVLAHPVAVAAHDRFILRRASPAATVAGGMVLALTRGEDRPRRAQILPRLQEQRAAFAGIDPSSPEGTDRKVAGALRYEYPMGASADDLARECLLDVPSLRESLARLVAQEEILALGEDSFVHTRACDEFLESARREIAQAQANKQLTVSSSQLRGNAKWPTPLWTRVLTRLIESGELRRKGDVFTLRGAVADMDPADRALMERILELYRQTGFQSPRPEELPGLLKAPPAQVEKLVRHLFNEGDLIRLDKNVVLHYDHYKRAQDLAVQTIRTTGDLDSGAFRDTLQTSRKYAIALLDYLDNQRITIRVGNARKLMTGYEQRLR